MISAIQGEICCSIKAGFSIKGLSFPIFYFCKSFAYKIVLKRILFLLPFNVMRTKCKDDKGNHPLSILNLKLKIHKNTVHYIYFISFWIIMECMMLAVFPSHYRENRFHKIEHHKKNSKHWLEKRLEKKR